MEGRNNFSTMLSIVVPVYKSEAILPLLVEETRSAVELLGLRDQYEILLVNDNSPDNSWNVVLDLAKQFKFVRGISLRRNFGQHNATMAGLNYATGKIIIVMDDDLQHPPTEIGKLLTAISQGSDVCYTLYNNRKHSLWKKIGSAFNDKMATLLLGKPRGLYLSSFKAMRKEIAEEVIKYRGPYAYLDGLILETTRSITTIEIEHKARREGDGNYNLKRSISLWLKMVTSFSVFPLRAAILLGFTLTLLSFFILAAVIIQKIINPAIPAGWTSLIGTVLLVGGIQTFCIGMVGEYLGRTYLKLNGKPQFVVGDVTWKTRETNA